MSTGRGIFHSEFNGSDTEDLQFLQIWVFPSVKNTNPEYHNYDIKGLMKKNELGLFLSPKGDTAASIKQDAWFSMGTFEAGQDCDYKIHSPSNGAYIFVIDGEIGVAGEHLSARDGIGIWETDEFQINITAEAQILVMEVPMYM